MNTRWKTRRPHLTTSILAVGVMLISFAFTVYSGGIVASPRPAVLFWTTGSEVQWLVLDIPADEWEGFSGAAVLRLTTPAGSYTDTLVDETLVTHEPASARPVFSQQLYFVFNPCPAPVQASLARGRNIVVELQNPAGRVVRVYQQTNRSLRVNPHPVALDRGAHISSCSAHGQ